MSGQSTDKTKAIALKIAATIRASDDPLQKTPRIEKVPVWVSGNGSTSRFTVDTPMGRMRITIEEVGA